MRACWSDPSTCVPLRTGLAVSGGLVALRPPGSLHSHRAALDHNFSLRATSGDRRSLLCPGADPACTSAARRHGASRFADVLWAGSHLLLRSSVPAGPDPRRYRAFFCAPEQVTGTPSCRKLEVLGHLTCLVWLGVEAMPVGWRYGLDQLVWVDSEACLLL